ncbi:Cof-type HAD-IIB family hydrolase [Paenibacillus larvae]
MEKQIVFFDVDGTLLHHEDRKIPESAKQAIHELQQKGISTVISTGRIPAYFSSIRKELLIDSYISINGQYVVYEGEVIYDNPIALEHLEELAGEAFSRNHAVAFCSSKGIGTKDLGHPHIVTSFGELLMEYPVIHSRYYKEHAIYQALLFCTEDEEHVYRERFPQFDFVRWHEVAMDVLPKGCSKAKGIEIMLDKLNIPAQHAYAFGDGRNDIEMLSLVGHGIAMGNAVPELKRVADYVTAPIGEDGIRKGLKAMGLIDNGEKKVPEPAI